VTRRRRQAVAVATVAVAAIAAAVAGIRAGYDVASCVGMAWVVVAAAGIYGG
jgi:hypothetical protein